MTITSHLNGNKVYWNAVKKKWYYEDGKETIFNVKCPKCDKLPDKNGHDSCLGSLPGVKNACCGHGVEDGYIQFENGKIIRFDLKDIN